MSDNKHITPYSASDIEKYRKGELSAREMHDLEQAALDDPFLADAIEGLTTNPVATEDLSDLRERLNRKVTEQGRRRKAIFLQRRIAFAAALILLLGIGYTFLYRPSHLNRASEPFALRTAPAPQANRPATPSQQPVTTAPAETLKTPADSTQYTFTQPKVDKKRLTPAATVPAAAATVPATAATVPPTAGTIPATTANPPATADDDKSNSYKAVSFDTTSFSANDSLTKFKLKSVAGLRYRTDSVGLLTARAKQLNANNAYANNAYANNNSFFNSTANAAIPSGPNPFVLSGKVLDLQNRPLAGAFLALNGKNSFGITTDEHGQFQLSLHPRDSTRQLTVSMLGYDHTSLAINALSTYDQRDNIIHLKPSSANLDEVVVAGYGLNRKAAELTAPSTSNEKLDTLWQNATPVIGRQAYIQYLNVAKKKLGLDSTITGPTTISFAISRDGTLSAFKIEQSLSPAHDAGIFRLVTDGPGWRLIRGKKVRASVTVNFP